MKIYNCIYNDESSTLRIERPGAKLIPGDSCVMETDIVNIKIFIKFICSRYPATGTNSTHLNREQVISLADDLCAYEEFYHDMIVNIVVDDLDNEEWRV